MPQDVQTGFPFFRQLSLDSFRQFLGPERMSGLRNIDDPKRRTLGLEGFLWLGLFVAS